MKVYNVIERCEHDIFVYTFHTQDNAIKKVGELKERMFELEGGEEQFYRNNNKGDDSIIIDECHLDIYNLDYEVYIKETEVL